MADMKHQNSFVYGSQRWILQDDLGCGVFGATQIVSKATAARPPIKLN
jgi:hypothetical protein